MREGGAACESHPGKAVKPWLTSGHVYGCFSVSLKSSPSGDEPFLMRIKKYLRNLWGEALFTRGVV